MLRWWRTIAALVLVVGSVLVVSVSWAWHVTLVHGEQRVFDETATGTEASVANSLMRYDDLLGSLDALFTDPDRPTQAEFAAYVSDLDLPADYPGVLGAGFVSSVPAGGLAAFVSAMRRQVPGYTVYPAGTLSAPYCLGSYASWSGPSGHLPLLGLDLCHFPQIAGPLLEARDTGREVVVAGTALGPPWSADFAFVAPVYAGKPDSLASRRADLVGWVAGLVDGPDVARAALGAGAGPSVGIELYTGNTATPHALVVSTAPRGQAASPVHADSFRISAAAPWTLVVVPLAGQWTDDTVLAPLLALLMGLAGNLSMALLVASLGSTRAAALDRARRAWRSLVDSREELAFRSLHDPLTGLPNRALFLDRLAQALQRRDHDAEVGVLLVDLDNFHLINDSLGLAAGDDALVTVARRIAGVVRSDETVARLAGDVFTVLLEEVGDVSDALRVVERITDALSVPLAVGPGGTQAVVRPSVGVVVAPRGGDAETLLRNADTAMNRAKADGRRRYAIFEEEHHLRSLERLTLEADLRRAIDGDGILVHYQPIVDLAGGGMIGAEALVRWQHPTRGFLPPVDFIPLAEETGLIVPLGARVLGDALAQLAAWERDAGPRLGTVSVNFSAIQLAETNLEATVRRALETAGVEAGRLCAEITESVFMADNAVTRASVAGLRHLGVRIGIDDFGTGYSSLAYLQRLPAGVLKIDRQFLVGLDRRPEQAAEVIVKAIVDIAHALDFTVVAEGVEEEAQLALLRRCGCDAAQGYLWSRPLPPAEFAAWAAAHAVAVPALSGGPG